MRTSTLAAIVAAVALVAALFGLLALGQSDGPAEQTAEMAEGAPGATPPADAAAEPAAASNEDLLAPGSLPEQILGDAGAPVTVIEYASLTCPHCAEFHRTTFPAIKQRFVDTGKVRFIFREFPLDNFATAGFMLARCAGEGKYFPILDAFFAKQNEFLAAPDPFEWVQSFGKQVGFTQESLEACLSNQELLDSVMAVRQRASEKFGVGSTPTFFINGKIKRGAMSIEEFEKEIEPLPKS